MPRVAPEGEFPIAETVNELGTYARSGASGRSPADADSLLLQANEYVKAIKDRAQYITKRENRAKVELKR